MKKHITQTRIHGSTGRYQVTEYRAEFNHRHKQWRWRTSRVLVKRVRTLKDLREANERLHGTARGSLKGVLVTWAHIAPMLVVWCWKSETVDALYDRMQADGDCGPILADALQDAGMPEDCPLLDILRTVPTWGEK